MTLLHNLGDVKLSTSTPKPTVGRVVHYHSFGTPGGEYLPEARAAIVTEVLPSESGNSAVGLAVMNPTGLHFNRRVEFAAEPTPGCWSWPPVAAR